MSYTKGPWSTTESGRVIYRVTQLGTQEIASTYDSMFDGISESETQANARLIAAAPDLLTACLAIIANPYGCPFCDSGVLRTPGNPAKDHDDDCAYVLIRAAIEKAGQP